jgi:hypothetical protein
MIQGVERPYELIFCNLSIEKSDLDEVMIKLRECPWELIIYLLNVLKCDFGNDDEAMFHDVERPFEGFFYILSIEKNYLDEVA